MTVTLLTPELRRVLDGLARRLGILERRIRPQAEAATAGHTHDGAGTDAVILGGDTQTTSPTAAGSWATAIGDGAVASATSAIAVGVGAVADDNHAVAIGPGALASGARAVALGEGANTNFVDATALGSDAAVDGNEATAVGANSSAAYANSVAVGFNVTTTAADQVNLGTRQLIFGGPASAPADANLIAGQIAFYLNEAGNLLTVKVKYAGGTVKTGTVALV